MSYKSILNKTINYYKDRYFELFYELKYIFNEQYLLMILTDYILHTYIITENRYGFSIRLSFINSIIQARISNLFNNIPYHILSSMHDNSTNEYHIYNIGCKCSRFIYSIHNQYPRHNYVCHIFYDDIITRDFMNIYENTLKELCFVKYVFNYDK